MGFTHCWQGLLKSKYYIRRYKRFLDLLKQARQNAGLSQVEAAQALGKTQSFISKCDSGERRVDFIELLEMAKVYGISVRAFELE